MAEDDCYGSYSSKAKECKQCCIAGRCRDELQSKCAPVNATQEKYAIKTDAPVSVTYPPEALLVLTTDVPAVTHACKLMVTAIALAMRDGVCSRSAAELGRSVGIMRRGTAAEAVSKLGDLGCIVVEDGSVTWSGEVDFVRDSLISMDIRGMTTYTGE